MSEPSVPPPPSYNPPPPPPPAGPASGVSPNRSIMIVLSYLWILALIPLLVEKDDREVQWHAKHGLVLTVAEFILCIGYWIFSFVATHVLVFLGCALGLLSFLIWIGIIVLHVVCIIKGVNGQRLIIPGISQYADRF
ncbi:MAG TPA: hypothetical protein VHQ90_06505 [Thermoanaerobaculia bacterium]|nr:hypothetical protein [Thermoanaerobaculia bacterium]